MNAATAGAAPASRRDDARGHAMRDLEHQIGMLLRRIRRGLADRAAQVHPDLSGTSFTLLATLTEFGPRRASDLSGLFALDKGAVSRIVHQLVDLGLVSREPDPEDGRASLLSATPLARQRMDLLTDGRREEFGAALAGWDPEEIAALAHGLDRLNQSISG